MSLYNEVATAYLNIHNTSAHLAALAKRQLPELPAKFFLPTSPSVQYRLCCTVYVYMYKHIERPRMHTYVLDGKSTPRRSCPEDNSGAVSWVCINIFTMPKLYVRVKAAYVGQNWSQCICYFGDRRLLTLSVSTATSQSYLLRRSSSARTNATKASGRGQGGLHHILPQRGSEFCLLSACVGGGLCLETTVHACTRQS